MEKSFMEMGPCSVVNNIAVDVHEAMCLLPDTENCGLRMQRECRERFPRHRLHM